MFPLSSSKFRRLASLPRLLPGGVRRFLRYYQGALTSLRTFRLASFPSLGNTMPARDVLTSCVSSLAQSRPEFSPTPYGLVTWIRLDLPSSRESSTVRLLLFSDPGRIDSSDLFDSSMLLPLAGRRKLQRSLVFRGSIARLSDFLCTLRSDDYSSPRNTRFRWLVRPSRAGFSRKALIERFSIT
jgi:hypothetical protein